MIDYYELFDLHAVFIAIRSDPLRPQNKEVLLKVIGVLDKLKNICEFNQIRKALRTIENLDDQLQYFASVDNVYTYRPGFLKDELVCNVLTEGCKYLISAIAEKNEEKIYDYADCLHELPVIIANNGFNIPKYFWKWVRSYRKRWDKEFLLEVEKSYRGRKKRRRTVVNRKTENIKEVLISNGSYIDLLGVYEVKEDPRVTLIELTVNIPPAVLDVASFRQRNDSLPEDSWQTAFDEHFLNEDGTKVIGDFINQPDLTADKSRITFFMYYVDFNKPLISQYGEIHLTKPAPMPERLSGIIEFEPAD